MSRAAIRWDQEPGRTRRGREETSAVTQDFHPGRRGVLLGGGAAALGSSLMLRRAAAQPSEPLRIGVLGDFSGPYSGISGAGSVTAARLAITDFGPSVLGRPIEI